MLNGAAVMDAALLLISANESCPQPQTSEHLAAIEIMQLRHILILQNKIDLVKEAAATEQYQQIKQFVEGLFHLFHPLDSNTVIKKKSQQKKELWPKEHQLFLFQLN